LDTNREADVVRSFVEMADTLVDDYDVVDLLTGLAHRCVNLLGVSAAGVMLASPAGGLGLAASSSEAMRLLELFELQSQEGPCLDAFRTGEFIEHESLDAESGPLAIVRRRRHRGRFPLRHRRATALAGRHPRRAYLLSTTHAPMGEADIIVARGLRGHRLPEHRAAPDHHRSPAPE